MAKLMNSLIMIFIIEAGLYLFGGTTYGSTYLLDMALNPSGILTASLYGLVIAAILMFTGSAIFAGTFSNTVIYSIYAIVGITLVAFISVITHLAGFISAALGTTYPMLVLLINIMIIGPMFIYYLLGIIEWVRANQ